MIERKCKICGKKMLVPNPGMWAYKKAKRSGEQSFHYYCSWKCLRVEENRKKMKVTA